MLLGQNKFERSAACTRHRQEIGPPPKYSARWLKQALAEERMDSQSADLSTSNSFIIPVRYGAATEPEAYALRNEAALWLHSNLGGRYGLYSDGEVTFEHVADAVAFKLAWGEEIAEVEAHNREWGEGLQRRMRRVWARR